MAVAEAAPTGAGDVEGKEAGGGALMRGEEEVRRGRRGMAEADGGMARAQGQAGDMRPKAARRRNGEDMPS